MKVATIIYSKEGGRKREREGEGGMDRQTERATAISNRSTQTTLKAQTRRYVYFFFPDSREYRILRRKQNAHSNKKKLGSFYSRYQNLGNITSTFNFPIHGNKVGGGQAAWNVALQLSWAGLAGLLC